MPPLALAELPPRQLHIACVAAQASVKLTGPAHPDRTAPGQ